MKFDVFKIPGGWRLQITLKDGKYARDFAYKKEAEELRDLLEGKGPKAEVYIRNVFGLGSYFKKIESSSVIEELEVHTPYGDATVEIKNISYHRGMIPCPSGKVIIDSDTVLEKILDKHPNVLSEAELEYILGYLNIYSEARFGSGYTEFLYPGGPGLGHHLDLEWYEMPSDEDIEYAMEDLGTKIGMDRLKKIISDVLDMYNNILAEAEKMLWNWIEWQKEQDYEQYEQEEGEEESFSKKSRRNVFGSVIEKLEARTPFGNATVEIEDVVYYQTKTPCPKGKIVIDDEGVLGKIIEEYSGVLSLADLRYVLDRLMIYPERGFSSMCIEFLYPHVPKLAHRLKIEWIETPEDRDIEDVVDELDVKVNLNKVRKMVYDVVSVYNWILTGAEKILWNWIEEQKGQGEKKEESFSKKSRRKNIKNYF